MRRLGHLWLGLILSCSAVGGRRTQAPPTTASTLSVQVTQVSDGDSFRTTSGEVRLIGVNAPERDECFGSESRQWLAGALDTSTVEITPISIDQFDRLLAEVMVDGVSVNQDAVATGHAFALSDFDHLVDLEDGAREGGRGLWGAVICGGTGEKSTLTIEEVDYNPPGNDDAELVVVGNRSTESVDLEGFVLRDESSINRFAFPRMALEPHAIVAVTTACGGTGDVLAWCSDQPVWNNDGDAVILLDAFGRVVAFHRY
ncbi:MAG TPA: lamin tail domain-containing protein [Acidimicrobiia bacterium]|nr:lamin tail domain-containing protein [Acidimicrobiia bacterium]